jgi:hypothetical protein
LAIGSWQLPWAQDQLVANLEPVKGLVGLARDLVYSRAAKNHFAQPIPKLDIAAPSAARQLGDGGKNVPAGNIARSRKGGKSGRLKTSGIDAGALSAGWPPKPWPPKPKPRRPKHR